VYENLDKILVIGDGFKRALEEKGIENGKVSISQNWIDVDEVCPKLRSPNPVRDRLGIPSNKRIVLYAGTMGRSHGTQVFLQAARQLRGRSHMEDVLFVLVGRGEDRPAVERRIVQEGIKNVLIFDPVERKDLSDMLSMADLTLVSLKPGYSNFSVPSKLLGYMAVGRPVLALVDEHSDVARIIKEAKCGEVLKPGDSKGVVEAVESWFNDDELCRRAGKAARQYCIDQLSSSVLLDKLACQLEMVGR
jgi:colanic acid biosynthesis glycosyl transferase WcaI